MQKQYSRTRRVVLYARILKPVYIAVTDEVNVGFWHVWGRMGDMGCEGNEWSYETVESVV